MSYCVGRVSQGFVSTDRVVFVQIWLKCQPLFDFDSYAACVVDALQEHFDAVR